MMNIGLVLLQKDSRYLPSFSDIRRSLRRSAATLPPMGHPQRNPVSTAKAPKDDTQKSLQRTGDMMREITSMAPVRIRRLDKMMNGRSVGRTVLNQRSSPELAPWNTVWGNRSIQTKRQIIKVIESICFIDIRSFGGSL